MVVSLAQIQNNTQDDIQSGVIDEFRKSSIFFERLPFDDAVTPGTGAGTLTYGYTRLTTESTAATRDFNNEYTGAEAAKTRETVDLKVFGGSFGIDRVFINVGGLVDEVRLQTQQKIKSTRALFHDLTINGDSGTDATQFDGLDVALTGEETEFEPSTSHDWSAIASQADAFAAMEKLDEWLALFNEMPDVILGNRRSIARFKNLARWAGYLTESEDAFGRKASAYEGIQLIDLGNKPASTNPIIVTEDRDLDSSGTIEASEQNVTDLYAVQFAMESFHGVTVRDPMQLVRAYLDELDNEHGESGAVRNGEVEMVAAVALRNTKHAGVFRNVKVD